ncbi:PaaI family thioesterase [Sphingorhabdus arenilitoris]|uniref:PaaI family thioesterase n=1 Tax=Sphingorhabdus arenilitoris TaxID=1490041 RepID=A0ABV8RF54_9SPHN
MNALPAGFIPHFRKSPLTDPWEPLYSKITDAAVIIAMRAGSQHCNSRGFVHGGMISALADNAMGLSCAKQHQPALGLVTVTLNMEFLTAAKEGQWLEFITSFTKIGRKIDFAQGRVEADGEICALMSATFAVPKVKETESATS